ncbi:MAG: hypothetical protein MI750_07890 [Xanthomonadales bacterium]|nr:hypothetical protein [Xanthomonadales bacterium]
MAQIQWLMEEKQRRSADLKKIDTRLLFALAEQQPALAAHRPPFASALSEAALARNRQGQILLDVTAQHSADYLHFIQSLEARIVNTHKRYDAFRIWLAPDAVQRLAEHRNTRWIKPADPFLLSGTNVSEGDIAHATNLTRANFNVDGSGVMSCAMSDSVDALAALQASGDLPPGVTVLPGQDGGAGTSEGTALMEIIFDLAPGTDLGFATGVGGQAQMAQNILDLAQAGCDVIVDDVLYLTEPVFQDGIIAQAVDTVFDQGVLYFSAAGNSGNLAAGTAGVLEDLYTPAPLPPPLAGNGQSAHDFGGGNVFNTITADGPALFTLQWSEPFGQAASDYDFILLDSTMTTVLAASTNVQDGDDDPLEAIDTSTRDDTGNVLLILQFAGVPQIFNMNTHRGRLDVASNGQIFGHPAAASASAVAAINVNQSGGQPFDLDNDFTLEPFSSDGPRLIFFNPDGSPIIPLRGENGVTLSPDYIKTEMRGTFPASIREMPDFAAVDGISTATPGFETFFGTSASAPHTAGIAALLLEVQIQVQPMNDPILASELIDVLRSNALQRGEMPVAVNSGIMMGGGEHDLGIFTDGFESGDASAWTNGNF